MARILFTCLVLVAALAIPACSDDPTPTEPPSVAGLPAPEQTGDGWPTASPASVGIASDPLDEMTDAVAGTPAHGIHSIVVAGTASWSSSATIPAPTSSWMPRCRAAAS